MSEMADPSKSNKCQAERNHGRTVDQDIELWKYHASMGGEDKNRMVTMAGWLLGFSAVILWYIVTNLIDPKTLRFKEPTITLLSAMLGAGVSLFALYISLMYGGYSNQNWEKADQIARNRNWCDLLPSNKASPCQNKRHKDEADPVREQQKSGSGFDPFGWLHLKLNLFAKGLARPCKPEERLAPVFIVFFCLATLSLLLHLAIFWRSVTSMS